MTGIIPEKNVRKKFDTTEQTANPKPLRFLVNSNLAQEQYRDFSVARCASWRSDQLGYIHHADVNRMIAKDFRLPRFNGHIDPGHAIFLLLLRGQLQKIVQPFDTTVKHGAIMSFRVPTLDIFQYEMNLKGGRDSNVK